MDFSNDLFASLRGEAPQETPQYAPFVDVDRHAAESGMSVEVYFKQIVDKVGPLVELLCDSCILIWMMHGILLLL